MCPRLIPAPTCSNKARGMLDELLLKRVGFSLVQMELQELLQRAQAAARTARQLAKPLMN